MELDDELLRQLIYGMRGGWRYTQDSPVLPDVWWEYGKRPNDAVPLLLTPRFGTPTGELAQAVRQRIGLLERPADTPVAVVSYNDACAAGAVTFAELFAVLLPLSGWYQQYVWRGTVPSGPAVLSAADGVLDLLQTPPGSETDGGAVSADLVWLVRIVGFIELARQDIAPGVIPWDAGAPTEARSVAARLLLAAFRAALLSTPPLDARPPLLWRVGKNRTGTLAVWRSRETVKADVAERSFHLDYGDLRWAIVDSGIDATHPAFRRRDPSGALLPAPFAQAPDGSWTNQTRIVETYDFTVLDRLRMAPPTSPLLATLSQEQRDQLAELNDSYGKGRMVRWDLLRSLLRVPHDAGYVSPGQAADHGTHVAGILAGDWRQGEPGLPEHDLRGVCPTLELIDLRVTDAAGNCDEFTLMTALQFIRYLNAHADEPIVQGANISLQYLADPANFAAGHTPVCEECERLVAAGVVTVVAAGNSGFEHRLIQESPLPVPSFADICIADPGNAESVITVGATHRDRPHTYGVSYFSSRGPTADGRRKPDLVAPGEKIVAPVPNQGSMAKDGTSMAAPHVSGAAAIVLARHTELIGQPAQIKRLLMETATDLGRKPDFQGAGLVDVLRALQAV